MSEPIIPYINIELSIDTFYRLKKVHSHGFTWRFDLENKEIGKLQGLLLDFLAEYHELTGILTFRFHCKKYGSVEDLETRVSKLTKVGTYWSFEDFY